MLQEFFGKYYKQTRKKSKYCDREENVNKLGKTRK